MEWAEKGENRTIAHRKMLEAVLAHPDNEPERALQKKLKVSYIARGQRTTDTFKVSLEAYVLIYIEMYVYFES